MDNKAFREANLTDALSRLSQHNIDIAEMISIGAGTGGDSLHISHHLNAGFPVLMLEAQPDHEPELARLKQEHPNVDYCLCAAAREDGFVSFDPTSLTGGAVLPVPQPGSIRVPARRIDSLVVERGWHGPFFLKFDTHGSELDILAGASKTLHRTKLIMMEVYNFRLNCARGKNLVFHEMCAHLADIGFRCVDLCDPLFRPRDGVFWQIQMFFVRKDEPVFESNSYSAWRAAR